MYADDLEFPAFLVRTRTDETRAIANAVLAQNNSGTRTWAPIRKIEDIRRAETAPAATIYVANKTWPIQVVTTKKQNLQFFENFAAFEKFHDFEDFPVKETFSGCEMTYIVVKSETIKNNISDALKDIETPKPDIIEQNGVKRPKPNSLTGRAWAVYDQTLKSEMTIPDGMKLLQDGGMNMSTVRTQYAHWRKFNGISK